MTVAHVPLDRSLMAFVNAAIGELQHSLGLADAEFFCECGRVLCRERLQLTHAEYERLHEGSVPVVVRSPRLSPEQSGAPSGRGAPGGDSRSEA